MKIPEFKLNRRKRVLVVDDRRDARFLTQRLLETLGHEVAVAATGKEALAQIQVSAPDVVLCDVLMPDMDGFEVARRIRADFPQMTLVAVTGHSDAESRHQAKAAGFDRFVVKPAGADTLVELLADDAEADPAAEQL